MARFSVTASTIQSQFSIFARSLSKLPVAMSRADSGTKKAAGRPFNAASRPLRTASPVTSSSSEGICALARCAAMREPMVPAPRTATRRIGFIGEFPSGDSLILSCSGLIMTATGNGLLNETIWHGKAFTGTWNATAGGTADVMEKATGKRLATVGLAGAADVAVSARAASAAQAAWAAMPYEARANVFRKAARIVEENAAEFQDWIIRETGAVAPKADVELHMATGILHQSAAMPTEPQGIVLPSNGGRMSIARRIPHGVVGVIAPFNFPLILSIRAVSPALATGNAVILKPDLRTPVSGGFLIARSFEEAGLPAGVLRVLPGGAEAGEALCTDPHVAMIAFTGSTANGRKVGALAGEHLKRVSLELGGKNSMIILDDADLDAAASNARWGAWLHQGQIFMTTGRILVQGKIAAALVDRVG